MILPPYLLCATQLTADALSLCFNQSDSSGIYLFIYSLYLATNFYFLKLPKSKNVMVLQFIVYSFLFLIPNYIVMCYLWAGIGLVFVGVL